MWLVAGLGNPGVRYRGTRHNAGFMVLEELSRRWGIPLRRGMEQEDLGKGRRDGEEIVLLRPLAYMNRSGAVVARRARAEGLDPGWVLVVVDDLDLPLGTIRYRRRGSAGGHKGLTSVIAALGTEDFPRIRMGIGRPEDKTGTADFVLGDFPPEEEPILASMIASAADLAEKIVSGGSMSPVTIKPAQDRQA